MGRTDQCRIRDHRISRPGVNERIGYLLECRRLHRRAHLNGDHLCRDRALERDHLLLQGRRHQRLGHRLRVTSVDRDRPLLRPDRGFCPDRVVRQQPGSPRLDGAERERLRHHRLRGPSLDEFHGPLRQRGRLHHRRHVDGNLLHRDRPGQRHRLLLHDRGNQRRRHRVGLDSVRVRRPQHHRRHGICSDRRGGRLAGSPVMDPTVKQRYGDHRLPSAGRDQFRRHLLQCHRMHRRTHVNRNHMHRNRARQRHRLLLQDRRHQRRRNRHHVRGIGKRHALRRPGRGISAHRHVRKHPGRPRLGGPERQRLGDHRVPGAGFDEFRRRLHRCHRMHDRGHIDRHDLHRNGPHQRHCLLLQDRRHQRRRNRIRLRGVRVHRPEHRAEYRLGTDRRCRRHPGGAVVERAVK